MDGPPQFVKPAQHVEFYVKRPLVVDPSSPYYPPYVIDYEGSSKPSAYSVDHNHSRFARPQRLSSENRSEPFHSTSLREVFERAILRGDVPIYSPDDDNGIIRNPSFITSSLPRQHKSKQVPSAVIGGDNYIHLGNGRGIHRSTDYFIDSNSESESESYSLRNNRSAAANGVNNGAYMDDASSTISDELFKSNSEGAEYANEEDFHLQPLPQLLDIDDHQAGSRSTLGGFFKPKFRDYPRNNVHRTSERQHKETIDCGTGRHLRDKQHCGNRDSQRSRMTDPRLDSLQRDSYSSAHTSKLPRTVYPSGDAVDRSENDNSSRRGRSHSPIISHNKYLPKRRRSSRGGYSPTRLSRNPSREETTFNDDFDWIVPASPEIASRSNRRRGSGQGDGQTLEQMEIEDPPWIKAEMRRQRQRRRRKWCICAVVFASLLLIGALSAGLFCGLGNACQVESSPVQVLANTTISAVFNVTDMVTTTLLPPPTTTQKNLVQNITLTFDGSMRIVNEDYTDQLSDLSSPEAVNFSNRFCSSMGDLFTDANATAQYDGDYQGCAVTNLTFGSIIVEFHLIFEVNVKVEVESSNKTIMGDPNIVQLDAEDKQEKVIKIQQLFETEIQTLGEQEGEGWQIDLNFTLSLTAEDLDESDDSEQNDLSSEEDLSTESTNKSSTTLRTTTISRSTVSTTTPSNAPTTTTFVSTVSESSPTMTSPPTISPTTLPTQTFTPATNTPSTIESGEIIPDCYVTFLDPSCAWMVYHCPSRGNITELKCNPSDNEAIDFNVEPLPVCGLNRTYAAPDDERFVMKCPKKRRYYRYSCTLSPEMVPIPLPLDIDTLDFEYVAACCLAGEVYDPEEGTCVPCQNNCSDDDSDDDEAN